MLTPVAVKVLPAELVADEKNHHRFRLEAQAASALNHPAEFRHRTSRLRPKVLSFPEEVPSLFWEILVRQRNEWKRPRYLNALLPLDGKTQEIPQAKES